MPDEEVGKASIYIPGTFDHVPPYDVIAQDHLWVVVNVFQVDPPKWTSENPAILDNENMISVSGPGCFYCGENYTPLWMMRRCNGRIWKASHRS